MNNVYAVAYTTKDDDGVNDLYVEALIATSSEAAVGDSMLNGLGAEIHGKGEAITGINVDRAEKEDVLRMVLDELATTNEAEAHIEDLLSGAEPKESESSDDL